ncbi:progranulin [Dicentrarchus labrax]|uniref:Granulins domain-containing protein n=1 Tax=Dicentrarchus labrax TaxID=13489 RepID=A0A8C4HFH9_DICLA|nr:progranulin [Dicentrarchus labrax]XP_051245825.1 progranulin [Dicentrarchus labrax]
MLRITLLMLVGVVVWEFASCSITCPDGKVCSDFETCCATRHGYSCCPYPKAVCCPDLAHCCPSGFSCNLATQLCEKENQPWMNTPMVKKEAAEEPRTPVSPPQEVESNHVLDQKSSVVHCDNYYVCPDATTCCRHPRGAWFCCPYSPGRCCLDGYHCCPYGYDCDYTYTHCVRQDLRYPFTPQKAPSSVPASLISAPEDKKSVQETPMMALTEASRGVREPGVIRCNSRFFCSQGTTCCKGSTGQWSCCPYPLGQCCADGKHCCQFGYTCDPTSLSCRNWFSQIPSGKQERAKTA